MRALVDSNHSFGFEINSSSYSYAEVVKKRGEIKVVTTKTSSFEENDEGKRVIDQDLAAKADAALTVLSLEATECLVRNLQIPIKKDADVNDALRFQAEPLLPFPLEEAVLDWIKVAQDGRGTALTFAAVKKECVAKTLQQSEEMGLAPEILSTYGFSLAAYSKQFVKTDEPHFIVHIGDERSLFALVCKGRLIAAQGSKVTLNSLLKALGEGKIESALNNPVISEARLDITRTIFGLAKQMKGELVEEAVVTGNIVHYPELKAYLLKDVEKNETVADHAAFALPIGLALQGVEPGLQVNFRQDDFAYPKPLKRVIKPLAVYLAACFALSFALFFLGNSYLSYRENNLREGYVTLLESMHKTYQEGEADFAGIKEAQDMYEPEGIKTLDAKAIDERLDRLEKTIKEAPDFIALNPNIPRVSDVLAWLTSHPNVGFEAVPFKNRLPAILIENFNYALIKRPEEKKRDVKYQAKVEIEFTSQSPKIAREFHDSLIAPNEMVDAKGEIKWSSTRGKYRTSFMLKDKTFYPSQRSF